MSRSRALLAPAVMTLALAAGCGAPAPAATEPSEPIAAPPSTTAPPASAPAAGTLPAGGVADATWVMPDLVGQNLQDAQNAVQALTDFAIAVTTSTDATGAGRLQLVDSNWIVCAQNVAAGTTITPETEIDFAAVKLDESC